MYIRYIYVCLHSIHIYTYIYCCVVVLGIFSGVVAFLAQVCMCVLFNYACMKLYIHGLCSTQTAYSTKYYNIVGENLKSILHVLFHTH